MKQRMKKKQISLLTFFVLTLLYSSAANAQTPTKKRSLDAKTMSSSAVKKLAKKDSPKAFSGLKHYRNWSLGVNYGVLAPATIFGGINDYRNWDTNLGLGASIRNQFSHALGIQANILWGKLSGSNKDLKNGVATGSQWGSYRSFETKINFDWSGVFVYNIATWDIIDREHTAAFFLNAGFGQTNFTSIVTDGQNQEKSYLGGKAKTQNYFPVGVEVKFKVTDRWSVNLGYIMKFVDSDDLDGTEANVPSYDKYSYGNMGIEYSLGKSKNHNIDWINPAAILYDDLKNNQLSLRVDSLEKRIKILENFADSLKTDSDNDGVSDYFDKEPDSEAGAKVDGSGYTKDTDIDGIADHRDKCPADSGLIEFNGCPDPNAKRIYSIQPVDTVYERVIPVTSKKGTKKEKKRKQSVVKENISEELLNSKQQRQKSDLVEEQGTNKKREKDTESTEILVETIRFEFNSAVLKTESYVALESIIKEIKANKSVRLYLGGHASQEGTEEYNLQLSIDRANAVKAYLVNAGIEFSRIKVKGYGESRPVDTSNTEEGRSRNRRVEIMKK